MDMNTTPIKRVILLLALLFATASLAAYEPFAISRGWYVSWDGSHCRLDDGSVIVFWTDSSHEDLDLMAQRYSASGQEMWNQVLPVAVKPGIEAIRYVARASDGNVVIVWSGGGIYGQKVTPGGQLLWPEEGLLLHASEPFGFQIVPNAVGGVFMFYLGSMRYLYGKNFAADGQLLWDPELQVLYTTSAVGAYLHDAVPDGAGGAIVNLLDPNLYYMQQGNHLIHLNHLGLVTGNDPLLPPNAFPSPTYKLMAGLQGDYTLARLVEGSPDTQLLLQTMDADGNLLLPQAVSLPVPGADPSATINYILFEPLPGGGLAYCWQESQSNYRLQRLDAGFNPCWPAPGVSVGIGGSASASPSLSAAPDLGLYLAWIEFAGVPVPKAQRITPQGTLAWAAGGVTLSTDQYHCYTPLALAGADQALFFWKKELGQSMGLYRQTLDINAAPGFPAGGMAVVRGVYTDPLIIDAIEVGDGFLVFWTACDEADRRDIRYQLYDLNYQPLLEPAGRFLNPGSTLAEYWQSLIRADGGKAALLYSIHTPEGIRSYLQEVDHTGTPLLPGYGLLADDSDLSSARLGYEDGDYYVTWMADTGTQCFLKAQRVHNGQKMWGEAGRTIVTVPAGIDASNLKPQGRYFLYRRKQTTSYYSPQNSYAIRVDLNGDPLPGWGDQGVPLIDYADFSSAWVSLTGTVQDNLAACINVTTNHQRTNVQMLTPSGRRLWGNSGILPLSGYEFSYVLDAVFTDRLTLQVFSAFPRKISLLQIMPDGQMPFGEEGMLVSDDNWSAESGRLLQFQDQSYACVWAAYYGSYSNVYYRYCAADGTPQGTGVSLLCGAMNDQRAVRGARTGNSALIAWHDERIGPFSGDYGYYFYYSVWGSALRSYLVPNSDPVQPPSAVLVLRQNFPNPFNPSTTVSFTLPEAGTADLKLYNLRGQLVRTLCRETSLDRGIHEFVWDGRDESGRELASGIYLCRLSTDGRSHVIKMVLAK